MNTLGILNGPNLDRLGKREPAIYGSQSLDEILAIARTHAQEKGWALEAFQSNHEGELIDRIASWDDAGVHAVVFNPGAYTHTSVALHDAIKGSRLRVVEVHLSNLYQREAFRHQSMTAPACVGVMSGFGSAGYLLAIDYLTAEHLNHG